MQLPRRKWLSAIGLACRALTVPIVAAMAVAGSAAGPARPLGHFALLLSASLNSAPVFGSGFDLVQERFQPLHDAGLIDVLARLCFDVVD